MVQNMRGAGKDVRGAGCKGCRVSGVRGTGCWLQSVGVQAARCKEWRMQGVQGVSGAEYRI